MENETPLSSERRFQARFRVDSDGLEPRTISVLYDANEVFAWVCYLGRTRGLLPHLMGGFGRCELSTEKLTEIRMFFCDAGFVDDPTTAEAPSPAPISEGLFNILSDGVCTLYDAISSGMDAPDLAGMSAMFSQIFVNLTSEQAGEMEQMGPEAFAGSFIRRLAKLPRFDGLQFSDQDFDSIYQRALAAVQSNEEMAHTLRLAGLGGPATTDESEGQTGSSAQNVENPQRQVD